MTILTELNLYPIKSCAGLSLRQATITPAGLMTDHIYDREWMVVDAEGNFLTQREFPRMAKITPRLRLGSLEVRAPGMLQLQLPLDLPAPEDEITLTVRVWNDSVKAYDCGDTAAAWFSNAIGTSCRLARFHPDSKRVADPTWSDEIEAPTLFADGFPMLVIAEESLQDLNQKLVANGRSALPMNRFRPNIVLSGVAPFEEDQAQTINIGDAVLKPVKPCPRCAIPAVDQDTGERGPDPLDILSTYRANARVGGAISFGMNSVLLSGEGATIRVGDEIRIKLNF